MSTFKSSRLEGCTGKYFFLLLKENIFKLLVTSYKEYSEHIYIKEQESIPPGDIAQN